MKQNELEDSVYCRFDVCCHFTHLALLPLLNLPLGALQAVVCVRKNFIMPDELFSNVPLGN
jgi:hypothetical protein